MNKANKERLMHSTPGFHLCDIFDLSGAPPVMSSVRHCGPLMNERTLSSAQTFWMKFVFPAIWIAIFGLGTLALFVGAFRGPGSSPQPEGMKWSFLAAWIAGTAFIYWMCARLKRVRIGDSALYVSNYRKEIRIPLDAVAEVTENRWINIHPVTIHLRSSSDFGDRITFMPKIRIFNWKSHPVVEELRGLAHV